jgi:FKBP-type peptidyl-prolyl cis-trans isomerase
MKQIGALSVSCLLIAFMLGCSGTESSPSSPGTATEKAKPPAKEPLPKVSAPSAPAPEKLVVKDLKIGTGRPAKNGDTLNVRYVGTGYRTGRQFDAGPYKFELGANTVQPGWEKGLPGVRVGGQRELIIPPRLTYYELGPKETLIYVVEPLSIR